MFQRGCDVRPDFVHCHRRVSIRTKYTWKPPLPYLQPVCVEFLASYIDSDLLVDDLVLSIENVTRSATCAYLAAPRVIFLTHCTHSTNFTMPPRKGSGAASTEPTRRSSRIVAQPKEEQSKAVSKKRSAKAAENEDAGPEDGLSAAKKVIFFYS